MKLKQGPVTEMVDDPKRKGAALRFTLWPGAFRCSMCDTRDRRAGVRVVLASQGGKYFHIICPSCVSSMATMLLKQFTNEGN